VWSLALFRSPLDQRGRTETTKRRLTASQVTVFLTSMDNFAEMNGVYEQYFTHKPARSCVAVKELPKGVPVEIEAIALSGSG